SHSWIDLVLLPERAHVRVVFQRPDNFGDLLDVADVVKGPLVELVRDGHRAYRGMGSCTGGRAGGQRAQVLQIQLALGFKMVEGVLGVAAGILASREVNFRSV